MGHRQLHTRFGLPSVGGKWLTVWLLVLSCGLPAYNQVSFRTKIPRMKVTENEMFQITFILKNGQGTQFEGPDFKNFTVLSKPSRFLDPNAVNRNAAGEIIYSYALLPKDTGTFRLPPASVMVDGKKIRSNSMVIEVLRLGTVIKSSLSREEAFVRTEVSSSEVYLGQQLIVDYKLYYTINVQAYYFTSEPTYKGFYAKDTHRFNSEVTNIQIDGIEYATRTLKRVILFPQQQGRHIIDPMNIRLGVVGNNLFKIDRFNLATEAVEIRVKPLSVLSSDTLIGAVGKFSMEADVSARNVSEGKDIRLILTIEGNGDIKAIKPPTIRLPEQIEAYPPHILEESFQEDQRGVNGRKVIEYVLIANRAGTYTVAPEFNYFDTDSAALVTLRPEVFELRISPDPNKASPETVIAMRETEMATDILGAKNEIDLHRNDRIFIGSGLFYILLVFPFCILAGAYFYQKRQRDRTDLSPEQLRRLEAKKVADQHLLRARQMMDQQDPRAFYDEISRATLDYVCDKLSIPRAELTKQRVRLQLEAIGLEEQLIVDLLFVLTVTEHILYSRSDDRKDVHRVYQTAEAVIQAIESSF